MIIKQHTDLTFKWFDAFNEHDIEKLLALYHPNADHYSPKLKLRFPETKGLIRGKEMLSAWWQESFERLPSLKYVVKKLTADEEQVFMEYNRFVDGEEVLSVGEVLEISNGKIIASRVYHG